MSIIRSLLRCNRKPDFVIGEPGNPYLERWWVIPRNRRFNIYLHRFLHDDDDRALHDHPWWNVSIILRGKYLEHLVNGQVRRLSVGSIKFRKPQHAHRIELIGAEAWSLFITGPVVREWGFHCPKGWVHWKAFTKAHTPGQIGAGCGEP